jgi:hypothetical protein
MIKHPGFRWSPRTSPWTGLTKYRLRLDDVQVARIIPCGTHWKGIGFPDPHGDGKPVTINQGKEHWLLRAGVEAWARQQFRTVA